MVNILVQILYYKRDAQRQKKLESLNFGLTHAV